MSNNNFLKGQCRHCGGHLEFPVEGVGQTVPCPHCNQMTELTASVPPDERKASKLKPLAIGAVVLAVVAAVGAAVFFGKQPSGGAGVTPSPTVPAAAVVATNRVVEGERTNDFMISGIELSKTPGSSLVYVTGKIQNLSSRQRFGVKLEFGLFDSNNISVGKATDYRSMIEPQGDWHFKAMVMESKATSARLGSIGEDAESGK